ncbi:hypothetical protein BC940DRAFT_323345 [Gongronella butleri]|nr:hypothetical protein BC940DRAFT_323345 [Gongronella butleri]
MPGLELPKGKTLYSVLEIDKEADASAIKKAYRRLALKFHPDKQQADASDTEMEAAKQQFQLIGLAYSILKDEQKKQRYDRTGSLEGEAWLQDDKDAASWDAYFRDLFSGEVNAETIAAHSLKYRGSEEEANDVLKYFEAFNGNMDRMLANIMLSTADDAEKFVAILQERLGADVAKRYPQLAKTTTAAAHRRRKQAEAKEAKEAEKHQADTEERKRKKQAKKQADDSASAESSLQALIMQRQAQRRADFTTIIDNIAARAAADQSKKRKRPANDENDEPSEDQFQEASKRLKTSNKNKKTTHSKPSKATKTSKRHSKD